MTNEDKQFCPLMAITRSCVGACAGTRCAWWVSSPDGGGRCAIQMLGEEKNGV